MELKFKIFALTLFVFQFGFSQIPNNIMHPSNPSTEWTKSKLYLDNFNSTSVRPNNPENKSTIIQSFNVKQKYIVKNANVAFSNGLAETTSNNFVLIGQTYDTIGSVLHWRLTLMGIDQNYNMLWKKSYGNNNFNYTHHLFSSINLIKKGNFLYSALFVNDSNSKQPGVFIKFNYSGDTIWQKKYYDGNGDLYITSVTPSADNGFFMTGAIKTLTPSGISTYLLKTDCDGNKLWSKCLNYSNSSETGYEILQDSATRKIYIVGAQDHGTFQYSNLYILDSIGNYISQVGSGGSMGNALVDLIKLRDGNFLASGTVTHPEKLIVGIPSSASSLVKFDPAGNIIFKKEYDTLVTNNIIYKLLEDQNGDFITGGQFTTLQQYNMGINDISRVAKINKYGDLVWKKYFDNYTNNTNQDGLSDMIFTSDGSIAFTNYLNGGSVPRPLNYIFYKTDTTYCDVNAFSCKSYVGIKELSENGENIKIYPNPANSLITIEFSEKLFDGEIYILNCLGQIVYKSKENLLDRVNLNTNEFNSGVYFIKIKSSTSTYYEKKIILVK